MVIQSGTYEFKAAIGYPLFANIMRIYSVFQLFYFFVFFIQGVCLGVCNANDILERKVQRTNGV